MFSHNRPYGVWRLHYLCQCRVDASRHIFPSSFPGGTLFDSLVVHNGSKLHQGQSLLSAIVLFLSNFTENDDQFVCAEPKLYRCPNCSKMLASRLSFREHVRRHTGECFVCDLCGQKFTSNSGFRKLN